jgi:hypothetical protein
MQCKPSMSEILPKRTYIGISLQLSCNRIRASCRELSKIHPHLQKGPQPCSLPIFRIWPSRHTKSNGNETTHHQFSILQFLLTSLLFFQAETVFQPTQQTSISLVVPLPASTPSYTSSAPDQTLASSSPFHNTHSTLQHSQCLILAVCLTISMNLQLGAQI